MSQRHISNAENTTPKKAGYDESPSTPTSPATPRRNMYEGVRPATPHAPPRIIRFSSPVFISPPRRRLSSSDSPPRRNMYEGVRPPSPKYAPAFGNNGAYYLNEEEEGEYEYSACKAPPPSPCTPVRREAPLATPPRRNYEEVWPSSPKYAPYGNNGAYYLNEEGEYSACKAPPPSPCTPVRREAPLDSTTTPPRRNMYYGVRPPTPGPSRIIYEDFRDEVQDPDGYLYEAPISSRTRPRSRSQSSSARSHPSSDSFAGSRRRRQSLPAESRRRLPSRSDGRAYPEESDLALALPRSAGEKFKKPRKDTPRYLKNREEAAEYEVDEEATPKANNLIAGILRNPDFKKAVKKAVRYELQPKLLDFDHLSDDEEEKRQSEDPLTPPRRYY